MAKSRFVYALTGACCAILIFVFLLLPRLEIVQASGGVGLEFQQVDNSACTTSCGTYISCGGSCGGDKECCSAGAGSGGFCLYCETLTVE